MKKILAERNINFYTVDAIKIGKEIGLGSRVNTVLQSAFFKIADIIPADHAKELMKEAAKKSYLKKGQAIVDMNYAAIDAGMENLKKVEIPAEWANATGEAKADKADGSGALVEYVNKILKPVNAYKGNELPVSALWIM
jgi:pyruvate-ferredoxin/flavodoxin oxidoreductase